MARVLTYSQKSMQRINRVVLEVEGAPLQALHRQRQWPIAGGGSKAKIAYITTDDGSGGNRHFARFPDPETFTCNSKSDGSGKDYEVHWNHEIGARFTGERILIHRIPSPTGTGGAQWEVANAGVVVWPQALAEGDIVGGVGQARLSFWSFYPGGTGSVDDCVVDIVWFDSTFNVTDGSTIIVHYDNQANQFVGFAAACPPLD